MEDELWSQLTDSEKDSWQKLQATIDSPGYVLIRQDLEHMYAGLKDLVFHAGTWEHYHRILGQIEGLEHLLNVEQRALVELQQAVLTRIDIPVEEGNPDAFA